MRRLALLGAATLAVLAAGAAAQTPAPAAAPLLSVKDLMKHVVNPAADSYWKGSGDVDTEAGGENRAPTSEEAWVRLVDHAAVLQESGHLLSMRMTGDAQWQGFSRLLTDAGAQAVTAAKARDSEAMFEAGSAVYDACFRCHEKYIVRPANSLWKQP